MNMPRLDGDKYRKLTIGELSGRSGG